MTFETTEDTCVGKTATPTDDEDCENEGDTTTVVIYACFEDTNPTTIYVCGPARPIPL